MMKRTKIVCTVGPACESTSVLKEMVLAGMNVARLNFSHGTHENHSTLAKNVRIVEKELGRPIGILQDLQGPKIRVAALPIEGVDLVAGKEVIFDTGITEYSDGIIPIGYKELHKYLKKDERLLLNDGKMETKILEVVGTKIRAKVIVGGNLTSHKGINVPDSRLEVSSLSEKDQEDAKFGVSLNVDFVALSFVRTAQDVLELRHLIEEERKQQKKSLDRPIKIISKIERPEALENIAEILEVSDGIMVARGDLGIELPAEKIPVIQKDLIAMALAVHKPVIVATQMLDSMLENPRPTRAEVSDVANAVIDNTDAVMLSNESAVGKYPVEAVSIMGKIIQETEKSKYVFSPFLKKEQVDPLFHEIFDTLKQNEKIQAILLKNDDGEMAARLSSLRLPVPLIVSTQDISLHHQLTLFSGIYPCVCDATSLLKQYDLSTFGDILSLEKTPEGKVRLEVSSLA